MQKGIEVVNTAFGKVAIRISAQEHLEKYYNQHGFKKVSEMYYEDEIPHVEMLLYQFNC